VLLLFAKVLARLGLDKNSPCFDELEKSGRVDNLYPLKFFEVCQVMVPGDDKVGFAVRIIPASFLLLISPNCFFL
jgi:hypothetical protein